MKKRERRCFFYGAKFNRLIVFFIFIVSIGVGCNSADDGGGGNNNGGGDINLEGWTEYTPTVFDDSTYALTDLAQPGSRLIYISTAGDDSTAELYFWNGTEIVDASGIATGEGGVAYGTDPMAPEGPIKPFRRWSYVAPRRFPDEDIGTPWDGTGYTAPGELRAATRYEHPDWWLFKRGETFDLYQDYLSFARETTPGFVDLDAGSLAVSGGRSETQRQIVGAYGSLDLPRPRFINPTHDAFVSRWADPHSDQFKRRRMGKPA